MNGLAELINGIAARVPVSVEDGDYIGDDGLMYCGKCHTPKQCRIEIPSLFPDGKIVPCLCDCRIAQDEAEKKREQARKFAEKVKRIRSVCFSPGSREQHWTFETDDKRQPKISAAMHKYAEDFDLMRKEHMGLLLHGPVGTGKSFYAACIANAVMDNGIPALMTNFSRIINTMQESFEYRQQYLDDVTQYPLLIIDDLGIERESPFMQEQVYNIIDARGKTGLPLIVTTNIPFEDIKNPKSMQFKRIYDRVLQQCHPIKFDGPSRRREEVKEKYAARNSLLGL